MGCGGRTIYVIGCKDAGKAFDFDKLYSKKDAALTWMETKRHYGVDRKIGLPAWAPSTVASNSVCAVFQTANEYKSFQEMSSDLLLKNKPFGALKADDFFWQDLTFYGGGAANDKEFFERHYHVEIVEEATNNGGAPVYFFFFVRSGFNFSELLENSKFCGNTYNLMMKEERDRDVFSLTKLYMPKEADKVEVSMAFDRRLQAYSFELKEGSEEWFQKIWEESRKQKSKTGAKYFAEYKDFAKYKDFGNDLQHFCNASGLKGKLSKVYETGIQSCKPLWKTFDNWCDYDNSKAFYCYCTPSGCGGRTIYVIGCKDAGKAFDFDKLYSKKDTALTWMETKRHYGVDRKIGLPAWAPSTVASNSVCAVFQTANEYKSFQEMSSDLLLKNKPFGALKADDFFWQD